MITGRPNVIRGAAPTSVMSARPRPHAGVGSVWVLPVALLLAFACNGSATGGGIPTGAARTPPPDRSDHGPALDVIDTEAADGTTPDTPGDAQSGDAALDGYLPDSPFWDFGDANGFDASLASDPGAPMPDAASDAADPADLAVDSAPDVPGELDTEPPSCDDGTVCTPDTFTAGACKHAPLSCGDADICTLDVCDAAQGCLHMAVPEACELSQCGPCPTYDGFVCVEQGDTWTCESDATNEVFVAAGAYWRGCNSSQGAELCDADTKPQHKVYESDFSIDRTEVTHEAFSACGPENGCQGVLEPYIEDKLELEKDTPATPVRLVDLFAASAYCAWAGKRLCWDAEWEKAARGGCAKHGCADEDDDCCRSAMPIYPWGFSPDPECPGTVVCYLDAPLEVGSRPQDRSPYGAFDMSGNVAEWCRDGFLGYGAFIPEDSSMLIDPQFDGGEEWDLARTIRGGAYGAGNTQNPGWQQLLRTDNRFPNSADLPQMGIGFRCCREFP